MVPLAVSFDASGSSDPEGDHLTYSWSFGDGSSGEGLTPGHTYTAPANYVATLTVMDAAGQTDQTALLIEATQSGLEGTYFNNWSENAGGTLDLSNPALVRVDPYIAFAWGNGSPDPIIASDNFGIRWEGQIQPLYSEDYQFFSYTDDGVRVWVDGQLLVDHWSPQGPTERTGPTIALQAGIWVDLVVEYFENGGGAVAELRWESASQDEGGRSDRAPGTPHGAGNPGPAAVPDSASRGALERARC